MTEPRQQGIHRIWPGKRPVIGMIHVGALPGAPRWAGSMQEVIARALEDARALESAGFDGVIVENFLDAPFYAEDVPPHTVAALTVVVAAVVDEITMPLGVNVLRNDARAALGIAAATGARFMRVNVHTGVMFTDQGLIEGRADETLRLRAELGADVAVIADVHVKHASPPPGSNIDSAARDAWHRGLADALIVSGAGTGRPTDPDTIRSVKAAVPDARVIVGSGVEPKTVAELLTHADGVIVGSAVMSDGVAGGAIDRSAAQSLIEAARAS